MLQPKIRVKFFEADSGEELEKSINSWINKNPSYKIMSTSYANYLAARDEPTSIVVETSYNALITYEIPED